MAQRKTAPDSSRRNHGSRRVILTAAFDLVGEVGYAKLSIEAIAARAGVGKQTIHRWWPSKGAVLLDSFLLPTENQDEPLATLPDTGDLEADLKSVLRAVVRELDDPRYDVPMRALTTEIAHDPELATEYARRLDGPLKELKKERLRSAQQAGQLAGEVDLDVAVEMLFGPPLDRWLLRRGPLTDEYADAVVETALAGLRPRPA